MISFYTMSDPKYNTYSTQATFCDRRAQPVSGSSKPAIEFSELPKLGPPSLSDASPFGIAGVKKRQGAYLQDANISLLRSAVRKFALLSFHHLSSLQNTSIQCLLLIFIATV